MREEIKQYKAEQAAWQAKHDGIVSKIRDQKKKSQSTDTLERDLVSLQKKEPEKPRFPHLLIGDGASASTDADPIATKNYSQVTTGNNSTASVFAAQIIDILDYANTNKYKTLRALSGFDNNGSGTVRLGSSLWISTVAISSIQIFNYGGSDFNEYSQFALYGIKG
jgi:hypothetical protein